MRRFICAMLPLTIVAVLPRISEAQQRLVTPSLLSSADRVVAAQIAHQAASSPAGALRTARLQSRVQTALLGPDRRTIELRFRDGGRADLLSASFAGAGAASLPMRTLIMAHQTSPTGAAPRAVVLEPFAKELGDGDTAGQSEADMLTKAGFQVDIFRNQAVSVKLLLNLSQYSLVYMKTHAGVLPTGGDAVIAAGDTATAPYIKLFGSSAYYNDQHPNAPTVLGQVFVDGGDGGLFNAIRAKFVTDYLSPFPDSSVFFLNGCDILQAPTFLSALQSKNLSAVVTWDQEVRADAAERGLDYTLGQMVNGDTLSQAISAAITDGVGTAYTAAGPAHLRFVGTGDLTLRDALTQATATPTATPDASATATPTVLPTSTPAATPTPAIVKLFLRVKLAHSRLKFGQQQKIAVTTVKNTFVKIVVQFPNNVKRTHTGHANRSGALSWSFKQPKLKVRGGTHTVRVTITVGRTGHTKHSIKTYVVG